MILDRNANISPQEWKGKRVRIIYGPFSHKKKDWDTGIVIQARKARDIGCFLTIKNDVGIRGILLLSDQVKILPDKAKKKPKIRRKRNATT